MNGTHLMDIGFTAAALLGLHAGSLFMVMASAAQTPIAQFAGYADLPGVRLWYTDSGGNGVPLVLLHANTGNADSWQDNIPGFVEAGYRVITFDRRGWGRSRANPESGAQPGTIGQICTRSWNICKSINFIWSASQAAASPLMTTFSGIPSGFAAWSLPPAAALSSTTN